MDRRRFLGALAAVAVAPLLPKPVPLRFIGADWGFKPSHTQIAFYERKGDRIVGFACCDVDALRYGMFQIGGVRG